VYECFRIACWNELHCSMFRFRFLAITSPEFSVILRFPERYSDILPGEIPAFFAKALKEKCLFFSCFSMYNVFKKSFALCSSIKTTITLLLLQKLCPSSVGLPSHSVKLNWQEALSVNVRDRNVFNLSLVSNRVFNRCYVTRRCDSLIHSVIRRCDNALDHNAR